MEAFLGTILPFGFNFAPYGWAICDGSLLSIQQNAALFSLLGTYYGGDGVRTFGIPDLRGRTILGQGQGLGLSPTVMGEIAGTENVTILTSNMPAHTHIATVSGQSSGSSSATATTSVPVANVLATLLSPENAVPAIPNFGQMQFPAYAPQGSATGKLGNTTTTVVDGSTTTSINVTNSVVGNTLPLSIRTPYTVLNYCIALQGIYPSRN